MNRLAQRWMTPAYLAACLLLGGSSQGIWTNALLQLMGLALIVYVATLPPQASGAARVRPIWWFLLALGLLFLIQLLPLPYALWSHLPGREPIVAGDKLLMLNDRWRPLSLSPPDTLAAALALIPPVAIIVSVVRGGSRSGRSIVMALAAVTACGLALGTLQRLGGGDSVMAHLYDRTNAGVATGFFANGNHMAALLLCALPFAAALGEQAGTGQKSGQPRWQGYVLAIGFALLCFVGLVLNGSLFGLFMAAPVAVVSIVIAFRHSIRRRGRHILAALALLTVVAGLGLGYSRIKVDGDDAAVSVASRADLTRHSMWLVQRFFPVGSGVGTFALVYLWTEEPAKADRFFVNHAHNDYLEWVEEAGAPGAILLAVFLLWWGRSLLAMIADRRSTGYAQAGAVASAILLIHSVVDFPLRTSALAAIFALGTGLMLSARRLPRQRKDLRPTRHLVID